MKKISVDKLFAIGQILLKLGQLFLFFLKKIKINLSCYFSNPNKDFLSTETNEIEWQPYRRNEHNYMFFQLNSIRNERNYFDTMYEFWLKYFHMEKTGHCQKSWFMKNKRFMFMMNKLLMFIISLIIFFVCFMCIYFLWKYFQKKNKQQFEINCSPSASNPPYPSNRLPA